MTPGVPRIEQWMRDAARNGLICDECRTRGIPNTRKFNWPLCDDCLLSVTPEKLERLARVIASEFAKPQPPTICGKNMRTKRMACQ